jgi:hypothetical protein
LLQRPASLAANLSSALALLHFKQLYVKTTHFSIVDILVKRNAIERINFQLHFFTVLDIMMLPKHSTQTIFYFVSKKPIVY